MPFSLKKPQKMMTNMTFFIKKLLPKNYDSAAEDSPSHKINDSAIFQNLRETVERDEEIINVSFCNFHIFDRNKISATFLYAKLFLQNCYCSIFMIFSNCHQEEPSPDKHYQMTLLHM